MPMRASFQNLERPACPGRWLRAANSRSGNRVLATGRRSRKISFSAANRERAAVADSAKPSRWLYPRRPQLLEQQECRRLPTNEGAWCRKLNRAERGGQNLSWRLFAVPVPSRGKVHAGHDDGQQDVPTHAAPGRAAVGGWTRVVVRSQSPWLTRLSSPSPTFRAKSIALSKASSLNGLKRK